ncbi:MAG: T9SS type A sorting domain-containing protein [Bacteroidia bacterium]
MKKYILLLSLALFGFIKTTQATTHVIYVSGIGVSPAATTANCGDTIVWRWNGGTDSTRSTSIPNCATSWSSPMDAGTPNYSITVGCAGTYNYSCYVLNGTAHTYTASITVSCTSTFIAASANQAVHASIYPNPAQNNFTVLTNRIDNQTLQVYDVTGKQVLAKTINGTTNIEADLPEGVYIVTITNNQGVTNKRLTIVK